MLLHPSISFTAPACNLHHMPGLLIAVKNTPFPALLRYSHSHLRLFRASNSRHRGRLSPRSVISRSKSAPTACKANSERDIFPVDRTAQEFLTIASKVSPFKNVGATVLRDLSNEGQEETLPAGYKLAEEGARPTDCHVLLHGCFLRSNGEGTDSLHSYLWCKKCSQSMRHGRYAQQGVVNLDKLDLVYCSLSSKSWQGCQHARATAG